LLPKTKTKTKTKTQPMLTTFAFFMMIGMKKRGALQKYQSDGRLGNAIIQILATHLKLMN
jgi:hypothetical protein